MASGRAKSITLVQHPDDRINRFQHALAETLNPILSLPQFASTDWRFNESTAAPKSLLIQYRSPAGTWTTLATLSSTGTLTLSGAVAGAGTVTSVALLLPAELTVSGSPITTSGTITATWVTESANTMFAGPGSGSAATPGFRTMVAADLPSTMWKTFYSVDFTSLVTQNFITAGDGNKTIDGKTWSVTGTGGATTFGITNGVGLVMTRASVDLALKTSFANLGLVCGHDDIELWYMSTNANVNAANEYAAHGVANSTASPDTTYKAVTGRRNDAGADRWETLYQYGGATSAIPSSSSGQTNDIIVCRYVAPNVWAFWSGANSGGAFPAFSSLTYRGTCVLWSSIDSSFTNGDTTVMGPYVVASGGDTKITLTQMKIMVRQ